MDAKLTLKLDKEIIELAKVYVKERGTSLSKFIEQMLRSRIESEQQNKYADIEIHPILKAMETGIDYSENLKNKSYKGLRDEFYEEKWQKYLKLDEK